MNQETNEQQSELPDLDSQPSMDDEESPMVNRKSESKAASFIKAILLLVIVGALVFFAKDFIPGYRSDTDTAAPISLDPSDEVGDGSASITVGDEFSSDISVGDGEDEVAQTDDSAYTATEPPIVTTMLNDRLLRLEADIKRFANQTYEQLELLARKNQEQDDAIAAKPATEAPTGEGLGEIKSQLSQIQAQLSAVKEAAVTTTQFAKLAERVAALEKTQKETKKRITKQTSLRLPFKLVSVDMWNQRPYAAILLNGKYSLLAQSEVVLGWQVKSIDFAAEIVVFEQLSSGNRVKRKVVR